MACAVRAWLAVDGKIDPAGIRRRQLVAVVGNGDGVGAAGKFRLSSALPHLLSVATSGTHLVGVGAKPDSASDGQSYVFVASLTSVVRGAMIVVSTRGEEFAIV